MELPRKILIGRDVICDMGAFIAELGNNISEVAIITGEVVRSRVQPLCASSLIERSLRSSWFIANDATLATVMKLKYLIESNSPDMVLGVGGGRSVDVAKMVAYHMKKPFVSIPTSASHDGMASPFVSIRGVNKPFSIKTKTPLGVLADTQLLSEAPKRLLASGCGDLVAKITAIKDWELARDETGEYYGSYAANLAYMSAKIIIEESKRMRHIDNPHSIRTIVEALISAGVAACIAGSSRPCSGAEHLFSHAIEYVAGHQCGLHGERVGLGTIMMAKLHGLRWEKVVETLENVGAPTQAREIRLTQDNVVSALLIAASLRPERYTILNKAKLNKRSALELAKSVGVL
jgi:glycerol-1-phosphate dehydrogenase [NAD(P)+]